MKYTIEVDNASTMVTLVGLADALQANFEDAKRYGFMQRLAESLCDTLYVTGDHVLACQDLADEDNGKWHDVLLNMRQLEQILRKVLEEKQKV